MATFSTHLLNSLDGTHLANVNVELVEISYNGARKIIANQKTDSGGRISLEFNPTISDNIDHEVTVSLPNSFYFLDQEEQTQKNVQVRTVSVGIKFEKANGSYHMPFILSPYGFSSWVSR